jgi:hypothetical protein
MKKKNLKFFFLNDLHKLTRRGFEVLEFKKTRFPYFHTFLQLWSQRHTDMNLGGQVKP